MHNSDIGEKMKELTQSEIQEELKKFGVETPSELSAYLEEYLAYFMIEYSGNRG